MANGILQQLQRESMWGYEKFARELQAASGLPVSYRRLGRIELMEDQKQLETAGREVEAARAGGAIGVAGAGPGAERGEGTVGSGAGEEEEDVREGMRFADPEALVRLARLKGELPPEEGE